MTEYTARIKHSESTFRMSVELYHRLYRPAAHYYLTALSLVFLLAAAFVPSFGALVRALFILMALFTFAGLRSSVNTMVNTAVKAMGKKFPTIWYIFHEDEVRLSGADTEAFSYGDIIRLIDRGEYLFMFIQNKSSYMMELNSIDPDAEGLKAFIAAKTGLKWEKK